MVRSGPNLVASGAAVRLRETVILSIDAETMAKLDDAAERSQDEACAIIKACDDSDAL